ESDVVAHASHTHAGAGEIMAEARLLAIHVVADRSAGQRTNSGCDQRVLAMRRRIAAGQQADDSASGRADASALAGVADLLIARVRVVGVATDKIEGQQGCQYGLRKDEPEGIVHQYLTPRSTRLKNPVP